MRVRFEGCIPRLQRVFKTTRSDRMKRWYGQFMAQTPCRTCEGSGYRGRIALYETLEMDHSIRDMTFGGASQEQIKSSAEASGSLRPLTLAGVRKGKLHGNHAGPGA